MRLLITGGSGTLGSLILEKYQRIADSIHVIDNFATSNPDRIKGFSGVKLIEGSIADRVKLAEIFNESKPTHVVHLAASYKDPDDWTEDASTNVNGMINTLQLAASHSVSKFINIQTVLCYGRPQYLPITEANPLNPESSYAISKVAGEQYLMNSSVPFVSLRLGNVISPGLSIGPIPAFYKNIKGGVVSKVTESKRDFLDSDDFMDVFTQALEETAHTGVFNVSTGVGISMLEIYNLVADYLGSDLAPILIPPAPDDIPEIVLSPDKALAQFAWSAKISVAESVRKCLKYYDLNGIEEIYSHLRSGRK
jgi:nucleoside-diphosphate-sugar epimerase